MIGKENINFVMCAYIKFLAALSDQVESQKY